MSDAPNLELLPKQIPATNVIEFPIQVGPDTTEIADYLSNVFWDLLSSWQLEDALENARLSDDEFVKVEMVHYREDGTSKQGTYSFYLNPETGDYTFNPPAYLVDEIALHLWQEQNFRFNGEFGLKTILEVLVKIGYHPWTAIRKLQMLANSRPDLQLPIEAIELVEA